MFLLVKNIPFIGSTIHMGPFTYHTPLQSSQSLIVLEDKSLSRNYLVGSDLLIFYF